MNSCKVLLKGNVYSTVLQVPSRLTLCTESGSLNNFDMMMSTFNQIFTEEFMGIVSPPLSRPKPPCHPNWSVWPKTVPLDTKMDCARAYVKATTWTQQEVCAVCNRRRRKVRMHKCAVPYDVSSLPMNLQELQLTNPYIIEKPKDSDEFQHKHSILNTIMLSKAGIVENDDTEQYILSVCNVCHSSLTSRRLNHIPKFSLKNNLYRGYLPEKFRSLT